MNSTNTTTPSIELEPTWSEVMEMFYQLSFFLVGTPINIYSLYRTRKNVRDGGVESRLVRLSRQLLIAHIMVLFIYGVWRSYWFYNIIWTQGNIMCKIFSFMSALPFHLWSNMVAAIAVDMLICITSPLNSYRNASNRVTWLITISWIGAIACSFPMVIYKGTIKIQTSDEVVHEQCYALVNDYSQETLVIFNIFHIVTTFYIPLLIVIVCYSVIGMSLKRQMSERRLLHDGGKKKKSNQTKKRFLRATVAIIATFILTWLPYQVLALLRMTCDESGFCSWFTSKFYWVQAIIIASTCINPFLYRFGLERKNASQTCSTLESNMKNAGGFASRSSERRTTSEKSDVSGCRRTRSADKYVPYRSLQKNNLLSP